jgi:hypothetical protein
MERGEGIGEPPFMAASISAKVDTILPELDRWATLIRQLGS